MLSCAYVPKDVYAGQTKERWKELCEQAAVEQDPEKLLELVHEINEILLQKQRRLTGAGTAGGPEKAISTLPKTLSYELAEAQRWIRISVS
jgi:hypothetical protein